MRSNKNYLTTTLQVLKNPSNVRRTLYRQAIRALNQRTQNKVENENPVNMCNCMVSS